jgi:hypothetical protein
MMQNRYTTAIGGLSLKKSRSLKIFQPSSLRIIELNVRRKAVHGATATALAATGFPDTSNTPDKGGNAAGALLAIMLKNICFIQLGQSPLAARADPTPKRIKLIAPSPSKIEFPLLSASNKRNAPKPPTTAAEANVTVVSAADISNSRKHKFRKRQF